MKTPDISTIHETVLHGDMRFHLMVHEFASDPSRSERVTSHWHEEYELLFLTEGNGTAHVNGRALPISAGDILFFNSGEVHSISAPPGVPLTFYAVVFGLDLISSYGNDDIQQKYIHRQTSGELLFQTVFHPKSPGTEPLRQSLEAIRSLYQEDFSSHELLIKAELLRIWHYLCRYPATQAFSVYPKDDSKILLTKKILRFIQEHYSSILTLEGLSAAFHMSEGQFCRFFKSQVHMTLIEYINYYRIGAACDRLRARKLHRHRLRLQQYQLFQPHVPKIHALHPEGVPESSQRDSRVKTDPEACALSWLACRLDGPVLLEKNLPRHS